MTPVPNDPEVSPGSGPTCPECRSRSLTTHTARLPDGTVLSEWFRCHACGHRWTTPAGQAAAEAAQTAAKGTV